MRRHPLLVIAIIATALVASHKPANASPQASQPHTPNATDPRTTGATRADLAAAYLRIDHTIAANPPTGERLAEVNREFDAASLLFFANRFDEAVRRIDALTISLVGENTAHESQSRIPAVETPSLNAVRASNAARLLAIERNGLARPQAIAACQARNRLLSDRPSSNSSAQFLADPATLIEQLDREIATLERGEDPFVQHDGDLWRILKHHRDEIPLRIYAPPLRNRETPLPLVIALHGAGGDENMFPGAYGAGVIKRLADEQGFILASPLTYPLAGDATLLDALIAEMMACYPIDRNRIYLIGHSLGAGAAQGLSQMRSDVIAATCCIAGGGVPRSKNIPPTLVIAAELDGLAGIGAADRGRIAAEKAKADGVPVEYRIMKDWGHTLVVGAALPDAIEWLLSHKRATDPAAPSTQPVKDKLP